MERELLDYQARMENVESEKKLRNKVRKYKAVIEDLQDELEREREMRSNSAAVKSLRNQLEEAQTSEAAALRVQKRVQGEMEELQLQCDELGRAKMEVRGGQGRGGGGRSGEGKTALCEWCLSSSSWSHA